MGRREVAAFESASKNLPESQCEVLLSNLRKNAASVFGRQHNFAGIKTISDFQKAVPIGDYDRHKPYIDRCFQGEKSVLTAEDPFMFATTSGTSGNAKYIPVTTDYMQEFRKASVVSGYNLLKHFPGISIGVTLSVVSPAQEGLSPGGIAYGAISGQLFLKEPLAIRKFISPIPYEVYLLRDYETRYYTLLRLALCLPLSCLYTLNPSTISLLMKKLQQYQQELINDLGRGGIQAPQPLPTQVSTAISPMLAAQPKRALELQKLIDADQFVPHKIWPELAVVACWTKAAAAFYLQDFPQHFGATPICDITYGASEGRGTVLLAPGQQALSLRSHFFEFIAEDEIDSPNPTVLLGNELTVGSKYFILFTTSSGLYRYHINDVVKVTGFHNQAPLLEFQYKGGNISSFTGEKITELQITSTMSKVLDQLNLKAGYFTVVPEFQPQPHYQIWLELPDTKADLSRVKSQLATAFDQELGRQNIEYAAKRDSQRLNPVQVRMLEPGSYESLRASLSGSGVADSQIKISHLNPKDEIRAYFLAKLMKDQDLATGIPSTAILTTSTP